MSAVDVLAVMDSTASAIVAEVAADDTADNLREARAAVAELIEADREVDAIEDELRRVALAGPRHNSYGTGWEVRDAAAQKERERRHEAAHKRRAAALARVGGAK